MNLQTSPISNYLCEIKIRISKWTEFGYNYPVPSCLSSVYPTLYLLTDDGKPGGGRGLVRVGGHLAAVEAGLGAAHVVQPEHQPRGRAGEDGHAEAGLQDVWRGPVVRQEHLI